MVVCYDWHFLSKIFKVLLYPQLKFMKNKIVISILISLFSIQLFGQVFPNHEIYPNTKIVKRKSHNGSGGKGYWSIKTIDSIRRVVNIKSYNKRRLLSEESIAYDTLNNEVLSISNYDINRPNSVDTNWTRSYQYAKNDIIRQTTIYYRSKDSTVLALQSKPNDSTYFYLETSYHYRKDQMKHWKNETEYQIIKNKNNQIIKWVATNLLSGEKEMQEITYYPNGNRKRRVIKHVPEYEIDFIYVGGPGADDQSWEYTYDSKNRIKKMYTIVENKKFKIATYSYD